MINVDISNSTSIFLGRWIGNCLTKFAFANHEVYHPIFNIGVEMQKLEDVNMKDSFLR